jgi:hypothetical protein
MRIEQERVGIDRRQGNSIREVSATDEVTTESFRDRSFLNHDADPRSFGKTEAPLPKAYLPNEPVMIVGYSIHI